MIQPPHLPIAARMLDKCRAVVAGTNGDYHFDCPLDNNFLGFAEITAEDFRSFIATEPNDEQVAEWISKNAKERPAREIIQWNNDMRDKRISTMPIERKRSFGSPLFGAFLGGMLKRGVAHAAALR